MKVNYCIILLLILIIGCTTYDSAPYPYDHPETWKIDKVPHSDWELKVQYIDIKDADDYINGLKKGGWELVSCQPSLDFPQKYLIVMRKKKKLPSVEGK